MSADRPIEKSDSVTRLPPIRGVPKANDLAQLNPRENKNFVRNNRMDSMDKV